MIDNVEIHLFYPLLFLTILVVLGSITFCFFKAKDTNIFFKHTDEHIDTTDKFSKAHTEIIHTLPTNYEQELHDIEKTLKLTDEKIIKLTEDINNKLNLIIERIQRLEKK